jgi:hypothetical protein
MVRAGPLSTLGTPSAPASPPARGQFDLERNLVFRILFDPSPFKGNGRIARRMAI